VYIRHCSSAELCDSVFSFSVKWHASLGHLFSLFIIFGFMSYEFPWSPVFGIDFADTILLRWSLWRYNLSRFL